MKNLPQRVRAKGGSHSSYSRNDKAPYLYPAWVTNRSRPPTPILNSLISNWRQHSKLPLPWALGGAA